MNDLANKMESGVKQAISGIEETTGLKISGDVIKFIKDALLISLECILRALGIVGFFDKTTKKYNPDKLQKKLNVEGPLTNDKKKKLRKTAMFDDIVHKFLKCLGREIIREIMKSATNCDGPCDVRDELVTSILG